jgi:hypothetical protein
MVLTVLLILASGYILFLLFLFIVLTHFSLIYVMIWKDSTISLASGNVSGTFEE